jgi:hypothetical protein
MINNLTYSIITHLKTQVTELTDVVWIYDGISLTSKVKPFSTVEQMQANTSVIAKERSYYETIYRFQVGLHANTITERSKIQEKVKTALLQPNITYLDTSGPSPSTTGFFYCDVLSEVPVPVESVTDQTNKHRVYFDVEVFIQRKNGATNYGQ